MKRTDGGPHVCRGGSGSHPLHLHPLGLALTGPLTHPEKPFIEDYDGKSTRNIRVALVLGALLYGVLGILGAVLIPLLTRCTCVIRYAVLSASDTGAGLGMTVVWSTVKEHGGLIDIRSEEGKGSTVELYLPLTREKATEAEKPFDPGDVRGTGTILVVGDVREQREIATRMPGTRGCEVRTAERGEVEGTIRRHPRAAAR
jgi:hypothetical protein